MLRMRYYYWNNVSLLEWNILTFMALIMWTDYKFHVTISNLVHN